ncbi:MAG: PorP/SprF family type IX secretion system membrane protein [Bacteroidales bacterium]|nr:PorP/SprF family type IX secretion system membrane protein [Bacteroidales bacterium]
MNISYSQDIHFSDFNISPLNLNHALTGLYRGQIRINALYRDQYRSVAVPYQTFAIGADKAKANIFNSRNALGYGFQINFDQAGDSHFGTYQFMIPLALHHTTYSGKLTLSGAFALSIIHNTIDYTLLRFPNQFDGDKYNEFLSVGENTDKNKITYPSIHTGLNLLLKPNPRRTIMLGLNVSNINKPNYSFYSDKEVNLKRRLLIHGLFRSKITENFDIIPSAKIQFQGTQQEFQFGGIIYQYLNNLQINAINYGLWFRSKDKDAVVLNVGFSIGHIQTSISYDINISSLKKASNGHGAFEIGLIYIYQKNRFNKKIKSIKCPSYL